PCGSNKPFAKCCDRFLSGAQHAKTPEQLMRSRFSAFFLGGYGQYLLDTWAVEYRGGLKTIDLNTRETDWQRLEIIDRSQSGNQGMVEFKAFFTDEEGVEACHHEYSSFERRQRRWLYCQAL
ncbi:MAG TPA: YchJ family metal-binding protein, partial [Pseudomonadales bacterium]|nr:YchJ family metal-binding protein [Pseudomonadales bacterium]